MGDDLELQRTHRAQQQDVAHRGREHLDRAFLAEFLQSLDSCFDFSGSRGRATRNSSGAKYGMPRYDSASPSVSASPICSCP